MVLRLVTIGGWTAGAAFGIGAFMFGIGAVLTGSVLSNMSSSGAPGRFAGGSACTLFAGGVIGVCGRGEAGNDDGFSSNIPIRLRD